MHDAFGNPVTAGSTQALRDYDRAVDATLHAWPGALPALEAALAESPGFALASGLKALLLAGRGLGGPARDEAARARASATDATARERDHVALLSAVVEGRTAEALERAVAHARRFPTDLLAASTALGAYGLFAFSGRDDHDAARLAFVEELAPELAESLPWLLAQRGWARIEADRVDEGLAMARAAIEQRPANGHAAHIVLHGYFERHDPGAALAFLADWLPAYPADAIMWGHLHWHGALAELALGRVDDAVQRLLGPIVDYLPVGTPFMGLPDVAGLLWRLGLAGAAGLPWALARDHAQRHFAGGGNVFAEVHLAMIAAAHADRAALDACGARLRAAADRGHAGAPVALHWAGALRALLDADPDAARVPLDACVAQAARLGGSHAQREVIELTRAALRVPRAN